MSRLLPVLIDLVSACGSVVPAKQGVIARAGADQPQQIARVRQIAVAGGHCSGIDGQNRLGLSQPLSQMRSQGVGTAISGGQLVGAEQKIGQDQ